jgi:hypothetical protein
VKSAFDLVFSAVCHISPQCSQSLNYRFPSLSSL